MVACQYHKVFIARAAPSTSAASFDQPISACTRPPMPQSAPPTTFSRPTTPPPVDEASRDELGVLHDVRGMTYHARHQDRAGRELNLLPDTHLVLVPYICRLEGISLRLHLERDVDDVFERDVVDMRAVPAAPAPVIAHFLRRDAGEGMVSASIRRITYFR